METAAFSLILRASLWKQTKVELSSISGMFLLLKFLFFPGRLGASLVLIAVECTHVCVVKICGSCVCS